MVIETYPTDEQYGFAVEKGNTALLDFLNDRSRRAPRRRHASTRSTRRTSVKLRPDTSRCGLTRRQRARLARWSAIVVPLAVAVAFVATADWARIQQAFFQPEIAADLFPGIVTAGVKNTLIITGIAFVGGLVLGLVLALMRLSTFRVYRWFATVYIEVFRGIPALVTLILVGFAVPIALEIRVPGRYGAAGLGLAIVAAAYMAETIRAGIQAVPRGPDRGGPIARDDAPPRPWCRS